LRLALWLWGAFVLTFSTLSYTLRFTEGKPNEDLLYQWSTFAGTLVQYGILVLIVYGIAGLGDRRHLLCLRRPGSWRAGIGIGFLVAIGMIVLTYTLGQVLHPGREQGITPDTWQPAHATAYVANAIVISVIAPMVEELTFRGLGYSLLARFGRWTAIALVGLLFGLAHGLVEAFPFLAAFGAGLAYLRSRVDSVYPGMLVHGAFNAIALTVAVADKPSADPGSILLTCFAAWSALSPF